MELKKWFALYTKPRHEFKALEQLNEIEVETYLPTITVTKQWSDRKKKVTEPLFKSYIFIYSTELQRNNALTREAVIKTIYFNGKPAVIPEQEMESIKKMLEIYNISYDSDYILMSVRGYSQGDYAEILVNTKEFLFHVQSLVF